MDLQTISGTTKLAILFQALGEDITQGLMSSLSENERTVVQTQISQLGSVSPALVEKVAEEFTGMFAKGLSLKEVLQAAGAAIKEEKEKEEEEEKRGEEERSKPFHSLRELDPEQIAELIGQEHPQVIAVIMAHFESALASRILSKLPLETKSQVAIRLASIEKVSEEFIEEVDTVIQGLLSARKSKKAVKLGGVNRLAEILNQTDQVSAEHILNEIENLQPELANQIKQDMFVFEDLQLVDDQGVQKILRKVEISELALALKGGSEEAKAKVFKNMSSRAAEMLAEEVEALGAVRMKQVEDAQQAISKVMREMEMKGEIIVSGRRGEKLIV